MNKYFYYIIGVLLIAFFGTTVYSLTPSQKGAVLDSFKQRQYDLIFESDYNEIDSEDISIFDLGKRTVIFDEIREGVEEKRLGIEEQYEGLLSEIYSLEESIELLDKDIENKKRAVDRINSTIISIKDEIESSKKTIELLRNKIAANREILLDYLVYIYKKSDSVSSDHDIDNVKGIILNDDNIGEIINDLYYKGLIQVTGKKLVDKHRAFVSELYLKKVSLENQETTLKKLRKAGIIEAKVLSDKKEFKENILEESKGKEEVYKKYISNKINIEQKLKLKSFKENIKFQNAKDKLLDKYGCEYIAPDDENYDNQSDNCLRLNKIIESESKLKSLEKDGYNLFIWPVIPSRGVSAYFQDPSYKNLFGSSHDAIDIPIAQGSSIRAMADGYVTYIEHPTTPDYSYVAIKHSDGFLSVYGHLSEVLVNELDYVKKGQVFAKSGGEFGTNGAGFLPTGPHLHLEVFYDKSPVDPLNFMDVSYIPYSLLDKKYKYKFATDFKNRKGYEFKETNTETKGNVFRIEGDNEAERQKYLINKYATTTFRDWNMWIEESLDGNLDPTFVMCIGLAETGLGRHLKTPYNVGNVGNTDSGATKTLPNARSGVYHMVRTLNNRYLSQYDKIKDLSRYGNKDLSKPIYASSDFNWHNNITKCMSHVKGTYIPDDYNFRLIK